MSERDSTGSAPLDQETGGVDAGSEGRPAAEPSGHETARRRFPWKSALALAIVIAVGWPVFSMLHPKYYERYEDLAPRIESWRNSTHARFSCADCHVEPGVDGLIAFSVKAVPAFYSQLLHGPRPENLLSTPTADACQKCHTTYRQVSAAGDLLIPHRAHVEALDLPCARCHKELVHSDNPEGYNSPRMTTCLECHDGEQASAECVDCHTRKQVPDSHNRDDWLQIHSEMVETIDCGECHAWSPDYCAECHSRRPDSHTGNWKKMHQYPAIERGPAGCMTCHDDEFCLRCHDEIPEPGPQEEQ
ncbi:MAG: hypothetical protein Kow0056_10320 [Coriobacteriia bacterium]